MARDFPGLTTNYLYHQSAFFAAPGDPVPPGFFVYPLTYSAFIQEDKSAATSGPAAIFSMLAGPTGGNGPQINLETIGTGSARVLRARTMLAAGTTGSAVGTVPVHGGDWHHATAIFVGDDDRRIYTDAADLQTNATAVALTDITLDVMSIGIRRGNSSQVSPFDGRICEVGIWNAILTQAEIDALANGVSPLRVRLADLLHYWPVYGRSSPERNLRDAARSMTVVGTTHGSHARMLGRAPVAEVPTRRVTHGYKVFVKAGVAADPDVDKPVAVLRRDRTAVALDCEKLGMPPNARMIASIVAFNPTGRATEASDVTFPTDGDGMPLTIPTAISRLSARPEAGGTLRVAWQYVEENAPLAWADVFRVEVDGDDVGEVERAGLVKDYEFLTESLADGEHEIRVFAENASGYVAEVPVVNVKSDATPPTTAAIALQVI